MALKDTYFIYTAKNNSIGLADVTAKIRRNGVYVLGTDVTPITLTEIDGGRYQLKLTPTQLTTAGGAGTYDALIDSASKPAPATALKVVTENDEDDLETHLGAIETKIDTVDANVDSIKTTVEGNNTILTDVGYGNANLKTLIDAIQSTVSNISNVTRFSAPLPKPMVKLDVGTKRYKIPVNFYNTNGSMEDPDLSQIQLQIADESGNIRDSYIVGFVAQPHYITKNSLGDYEFELDIPDTAGEEQVIFSFSLLENSIPLSHKAVTEIQSESATAGLALETTAQNILTDTADMQPKVTTILTAIQDAGFGLQALQALLNTIDTNTDGLASEIGNATYGLSALRVAIDTKASQLSVTNVDTKVTDAQGAGFATGTDSLKAISDRTYTGGTAV